jgi:hypothetical protein
MDLFYRAGGWKLDGWWLEAGSWRLAAESWQLKR